MNTTEKTATERVRDTVEREFRRCDAAGMNFQQKRLALLELAGSASLKALEDHRADVLRQFPHLRRVD